MLPRQPRTLPSQHDSDHNLLQATRHAPLVQCSKRVAVTGKDRDQCYSASPVQLAASRCHAHSILAKARDQDSASRCRRAVSGTRTRPRIQEPIRAVTARLTASRSRYLGANSTADTRFVPTPKSDVTLSPVNARAQCDVRSRRSRAVCVVI